MISVRYPRARSVGFSILIFLSLSLQGCSCQERYRPAMEQWIENLEQNVRPAFKTALDGSRLPEDLQQSKLGVLDDTISGMKRVNGEGPEVWGDSSE